MKSILTKIIAILACGFGPMLWFELCRHIPVHPIIQVDLILGGILTVVAIVAFKQEKS